MCDKCEYSQISCHFNNYGLTDKSMGIEFIKALRDRESKHYSYYEVVKESFRSDSFKNTGNSLFYFFHTNTPNHFSSFILKIPFYYTLKKNKNQVLIKVSCSILWCIHKMEQDRINVSNFCFYIFSIRFCMILAISSDVSYFSEVSHLRMMEYVPKITNSLTYSFL